MINVDSKMLAMLQASSCFGLAYDETIPECKQCDVKSQCQAKSAGIHIDTPTTRLMKEATDPVKPEVTKQKANTPKKTNTVKKAVSQAPKVVDANMPNFKDMTLDQLKSDADKLGVEWKDYNNDSITRMRIIMALKKCYTK